MRTKIIPVIILFTLSITSSFGQFFEGVVVYDNAYKSKFPNVSDEQLTSMMGSKQEYLIKGGDYKSITNGTLMQWSVYVNKDNKLYSKMSNSPVILWNDGGVNTDEITKSEINKGAAIILGYTCDELILTCKSGVEKYYFNSKLKMDAKLFEKHKFGNWNEYLSKSGAIPLKMVIEKPQFTLVSTATEVKPTKLDEKQFELPAGSKTEKSPY